MAERLTLETIIKYVILLLAFGLILIAILYGVGSPLIKNVSNFFSLNSTQPNLVEVNKDLPFYSEFVKNYKECKLSPATDCFCALTNPATPDNYVIELTNSPSSKTTTITLHGNVKEENCGELSATKDLKDIQSISTLIDDDLLYFKNYYFYPGKDTISGTNFEIFTKTDFTTVQSIFLYKNEFCVKETDGSSSSLSSAKSFIYKFSSQETTIETSIKNLKRCTTVKDALPADDEFNKLFSAITSCSQGLCSFSIKSSDQAPSDIPQDYTISLEGQKLNLAYKDTVVKTLEIKKQTCQFSDFRNIDQNKGTQVSNLVFNNYIGIEIYPFNNKVCILPYTPDLKKQKDLLIENLKSKTLIPG